MEIETDIVILAAGKGTRMKADLPKVLIEVEGKPMVSHLLDTVRTITSKRPIVVASPSNIELLKSALKSHNPRFLIQEEQLGTGDAVASVLRSRVDLASNLLILYGDHPLISKDTIDKLIDKHRKNGAKFTMLVASVPSYRGKYRNFYHDGRILRTKKGRIRKIVEPSDATSEIMKIKEINPAIFVVNTGWLKKNISKIQINELKKEYYLTQLIEIAMRAKTPIQLVEGNIDECFGVNTKEELETVKKLLTS